jgi:hypothetical protein
VKCKAQYVPVLLSLVTPISELDGTIGEKEGPVNPTSILSRALQGSWCVLGQVQLGFSLFRGGYQGEAKRRGCRRGVNMVDILDTHI